MAEQDFSSQQKALDKLTSPEMLDQRLVVVSSKGWIALLCTSLLLIGGILWAFFGEIPSTLSTKVIFLNKEGLEVIRSPGPGMLTDIAVKENQEISPDTTLAYLQQTKEQKKIVSGSSGLIIEVIVPGGTKVEEGSMLFLLEKPSGNYIFYAYLPIEQSQLVKPGMTAYMQIVGINAQLYGEIVGKVVSLSPFVVSENHLSYMLGDRSLVNYFTQQQPVVEVLIQPQINPNTPSGYQWTSKKGPAKKIPPRSIGTALIILESRRPITYVFPLLHPTQASS